MLTEILLTVLTLTVVGIFFFFAQIRNEIIQFLRNRNPPEISPIDTNEVIREVFDDNRVHPEQETVVQPPEITHTIQTQPCSDLIEDSTKITPSNVPYGAVPKETADKPNFIKAKISNVYNYVVGKSQKSTQNILISDSQLKNQKLKKSLLKNLVLCSTSATMPVYKLNMHQIFTNSIDQVRKCEIGVSKIGKCTRNEKVIMILGATGSGKTTLINSMVNYMIGVEYKDPFRFKLITDENEGRGQAFSQTSWITAYTIHHQEGFKVPYTLTIIDTPGYGDSSGIHRDMEITKQVHNFFAVPGPKGIDRIDAVGFVIQSSLPRLTPTQQYIFDQILSLFGKDIEENIYLMLTFADGKKPQVLNGVREAGLPFQAYFKFNNSVIFEDSKTGDNFDQMFWLMGMQSFEQFFRHFHKITPKSLTQTKSVLEEREIIETQIVGLQHEISRGLNKLEQLKKEVEVVHLHKSEIARNENFYYTVDEESIVRHDLEPGTFVTNCLICNFSCHNPCKISNDEHKYKCAAMNKVKNKTEIMCRICPQKCYWQNHKNMQFYFSTELEEVTKTSDDLKQRYHDANGKMLKATEIVEDMREEFEAVQIKVIGITEILRKSITKLNEIALKPAPLSTPEYIDILIESERAAAKPGWKERMRSLNEVRNKVQQLAEIAKQGFDPFESYKRKIEEDKRTQRGTWSAVGDYLMEIKFW